MQIKKFKKKKDDHDKIISLDDEIAKLYEEPKGVEVFYNISLGFATSMIGTAILLSLGVPFGIGCAVCIPTLGPTSIIGLNALKKKVDRNFNADMQEFQQIVKMFTELKEKDHKIEKKTAYFYYEIESKEELANLDHGVYNNINKFLYMINENYYEEIASKYNFRRDELIDKILDQIAIYVSKYGMYEFTLDEAKPIINGCIFIEDSLKKKMLKEFKQSEYHFNGRKHYRILSKNLDSKKNHDVCIAESNEERKSTDHYLRSFDINAIEWYEFLLECASKSETEYGNVYNVEWDLECVRDIMAFMLTNFHFKFTEYKGEYYNVDVVISFMHNVFVYASVNNTGKIGINEMIQTFKHWNFFEGYFNLKLEVLDAIFENFDLDYNMHPYRETKKSKKENKVLSFPKVGD